jgi:hypothetical protein
MANQNFRLAWSIENGKFKYELIKNARKRVDRAIKSGFYIEATALLESLIADRLESSIENKTGEIQRVQNLGPLIKIAISQVIISEDFAADIRSWSNNRAKVVHEMVKVSNKNSGNWRERIAFARELAMQGKEILRKLEVISRQYRPKR